MRRLRLPEDIWWTRTRSFLEQGFSELQIATAGTLLGVPLINRNTGTFTTYVEGEHEQAELKAIGKVDSQVLIRVDYLDKSPEDVVGRLQPSMLQKRV